MKVRNRLFTLLQCLLSVCTVRESAVAHSSVNLVVGCAELPRLDLHTPFAFWLRCSVNQQCCGWQVAYMPTVPVTATPVALCSLLASDICICASHAAGAIVLKKQLDQSTCKAIDELLSPKPQPAGNGGFSTLYVSQHTSDPTHCWHVRSPSSGSKACKRGEQGVILCAAVSHCLVGHQVLI